MHVNGQDYPWAVLLECYEFLVLKRYPDTSWLPMDT